MREIDSREKTVDALYDKISGIIEPGDLIFYITQFPPSTLKEEVRNDNWRAAFRTRMMPHYRTWFGLERDDFDTWHVGIFCTKKKRKHHRRTNLWIIHSTVKKGVHIEQLSPRQFSNDERLGQKSRVEILQLKGITNEQREQIVKYAYSKVGCGFEHSYGANVVCPYMLGLPNFWHHPNRFSCQQIVICAYAQAGIYFRHPYKTFPVFNIGRILGHPLGHPRDHVDPRQPYLMDHHIYLDPRFSIKAAVFQDGENDEWNIELGNLRKWSWNAVKRDRYIEKKLFAADQ